MKLTYTQLGQTFECGKPNQIESAVNSAIETLAQALDLHPKSIHYLLQNGWSQSLQDSFAGPRAKAIKDGEYEATIEEVTLASIAKRVESIKSGLLSANGSGGRDPIKTVAKDLLAAKAASLGKHLPKNKEKLASMIDAYIAANRPTIDSAIRKRRQGGDEIDLSDIVA